MSHAPKAVLGALFTPLGAPTKYAGELEEDINSGIVWRAMERAPEKRVSMEWGHIILKYFRYCFRADNVNVSTVGPSAGWAPRQHRDFEHGSPEFLLYDLMKCNLPFTRRRLGRMPPPIIQRLDI